MKHAASAHGRAEPALLHHARGNWQQERLGDRVYEPTIGSPRSANAWMMEDLLDKHGAIMDKYDPEKKVGLIVDEWGTWCDVEPGTNPGFLYQQNTLRDALVAGLTLNMFNAHCDRVQMANIAQTVNVLQAMILTDGAQNASDADLPRLRDV